MKRTKEHLKVSIFPEWIRALKEFKLSMNIKKVKSKKNMTEK